MMPVESQSASLQSSRLDIGANRAARKYARREQAARVVWGAARWVFRLSPRPCFGWRNWLLRRFGATIGQNVRIDNTAIIFMPWNLTVGDWSAIGSEVLVYNLGRVTLGKRVTVSHRAHLCAGTHDYRRVDLPLLKPPIVLRDEAWICADAFVGPGVEIGAGAVVGARAVAMRDVPVWAVAAGNPAVVIKQRELASGGRRGEERS